MKWPDNAQSLLTGEIVGRLTDVTQNGHKIPDEGNTFSPMQSESGSDASTATPPRPAKESCCPDWCRRSSTSCPTFPASSLPLRERLVLSAERYQMMHLPDIDG
jgi:hypothetical protein